MKRSTVQILYDSGFGIGPVPDEMHSCGHRWGDHILLAPWHPLDGGLVACPDCSCKGTWDTTAPEDVKARLREL